jgi:4-amino-4-deoxy-L-arabinose transferase-like glycosyltransferase
MFLLTFSIAMAFSIFLVSLIRGLTRLGFLFSLYLFFTAQIILCFEIAGLLRVLDQTLIFLILQLSLLVIGTVLWLLQKKPPLFEPFLGIRSKTILRDSKVFLRKNPILAVFLGGIVIAYVINAALIVIVPPNNTDGFYLHMTRVGYWLQNKSFLPFKTFFNIQVFYPLNAQAQIYWTVLFTRSDMLVGFIQFFAALFSSLAVFGIARLLGFRKTQALFASLLWLSFPQVLFQSTSVQNDLVPAAYLAISLFFLVQWSKTTTNHHTILLSALSLALALGTKQTVFFILPGLGIMMLLLAIKGKQSWRFVKFFWSSFLIFFLLFGSVIYIQNQLVYKNFMGESKTIGAVSNINSSESVLSNFWLNFNRITYDFFDTTGLPPILEGYLHRGKAFVAQRLYSFINLPMESSIGSNPSSKITFNFLTRYPVSEDFVWFGFFAPLLLIPLSIYQGYYAIKKRDPIPIGLLFVSCSFILFELLIRPGWDVNIGRNFTIAIIPIIAFTATLYQTNVKSKLGTSIIVLLSLFIVFNLLLHNPAKPLVGDNAIWNLPRNEKLALQNGWVLSPLNMVEKKVPGKAVLGIFGSFFEYPFFGEHFQRTLVPLSLKQLQDNSFLNSKAVDFILVRHPKSSNLPEKQTWELIDRLSDWALYQRINP